MWGSPWDWWVLKSDFTVTIPPHVNSKSKNSLWFHQHFYAHLKGWWKLQNWRQFPQFSRNVSKLAWGLAFPNKQKLYLNKAFICFIYFQIKERWKHIYWISFDVANLHFHWWVCALLEVRNYEKLPNPNLQLREDNSLQFSEMWFTLVYNLYFLFIRATCGIDIWWKGPLCALSLFLRYFNSWMKTVKWTRCESSVNVQTLSVNVHGKCTFRAGPLSEARSLALFPSKPSCTKSSSRLTSSSSTICSACMLAAMLPRAFITAREQCLQKEEGSKMDESPACSFTTSS